MAKYEVEIDGQWVPQEADSPEEAAELAISGQRQTATQQLAQRMAQKPFLEQALIGAGRGMTNVGLQLGNILGLTPDETLERYKELDRPLMETTGGQVGSVAGEVAALAPLAGGGVAAGARGLGALMPSVRTAMGATRAGQVAAGAGTGLAEGAIEGAVVGGPGQRAEGALTGSLLGAGGGAMLPLLTRGFRTPSESAQTIMGMTPSPDLTPGMMKPGGAVSQLEQAAGSFGIIGPTIRGARETPQRQFAQAMINEGRPPGAAPVAASDVNAMLDEVYTSFEPAYGQLKDIPVDRVIASDLAGEFERAANSQIVAATDDARKAVNRYLDNQVSLIDNTNPTTTDLLDIRSNIREQSRKAAKSQNWEKAELFDEAENAITERINQALPEGFADLNRQIDQQYAKHKIAESAIYKMGNREFPTPTQWQQAVRESATRGEFARGGGLMRPQTQAAADVFRTTEPTTGARLATLGSIGAGLGGAAGIATGGIDPVMAGLIGGPLALLAGTRGGRRFAVGETGLQQMMQRASRPMSFMDIGVPVLPGMYTRAIAPIAGQED